MSKVIFYDFDIDAHADEKWGHIIDDNLKAIPKFRLELIKMLNSLGTTVTVTELVHRATSPMDMLYYDEIYYLAQRLDLQTHHILLLQLVYEAFSGCTAAVLKVGKKDFFFRTMDWPLDFLRKVTVGLNVIKDGKTIGRVTTWLGYVGFLTATSVNNNYTISINYRKTKDISISALIGYLFRNLTPRWQIGCLVRSIIEKDYDASTARSVLESTELMLPCYATLFIPKYQSYVITRDSNKLVSTRNNELIQTNCDWNKTTPNLLYSVERMKFVKAIQREINRSSKKKWSSEELLELLLEYPVLNEETLYYHYQYGDEFGTFVNDY
jgi:hypothetical protein